jgi:hypothetical protein
VVDVVNDAFPVFSVGEAAFTTGEFSGAPNSNIASMSDLSMWWIHSYFGCNWCLI